MASRIRIPTTDSAATEAPGSGARQRRAGGGEEGSEELVDIELIVKMERRMDIIAPRSSAVIRHGARSEAGETASTRT